MSASSASLCKTCQGLAVHHRVALYGEQQLQRPVDADAPSAVLAAARPEGRQRAAHLDWEGHGDMPEAVADDDGHRAVRKRVEQAPGAGRVAGDS